MTEVLLIMVYLIGCILSYGRFVGNAYQNWVECGAVPKWYKDWVPLLCGINIILCSWGGFLMGLVIYLINPLGLNNEPFLKFNYEK